jgi:hypothetical protein
VIPPRALIKGVHVVNPVKENCSHWLRANFTLMPAEECRRRSRVRPSNIIMVGSWTDS